VGRPTLPRVIEKLRRVKELHGDVLAEFCLTAQTLMIDHRVPLTHIEAMTIPSAEQRRQEEAEIKSWNGNNSLLPTRLTAAQ